jgi:hypothetical protein
MNIPGPRTVEPSWNVTEPVTGAPVLLGDTVAVKVTGTPTYVAVVLLSVVVVGVALVELTVCETVPELG